MSGFKDGGGVIVPGYLEFTGLDPPKIISYYFHVTIATTIILKMEWNIYTSCGISIFHMLKKGEGLLHACISSI
jgi:hypothetical protein